jgi:hypothetical protein
MTNDEAKSEDAGDQRAKKALSTSVEVLYWKIACYPLKFRYKVLCTTKPSGAPKISYHNVNVFSKTMHTAVLIRTSKPFSTR